MAEMNGQVEIQKAKGRPMLQWVGKRPLDQVTAYPAQLVESFAPKSQTNEELKDEIWQDWPEKFPKGGLLFHGDNKDVLAYLLANGYRGKVDLIYIDPPFDSGADYVRKVALRGLNSRTQLESENYSLGEQIQYEDIWANDNYLQFLYERLVILKEILNENGSLVIHLNSKRVHYVKILLDEIFGDNNFRNEIIVKRIRKSYIEKSGINSLNEGVDYLLLFTKSPLTKFLPPLKYNPLEERWHAFDAPSIRENLTYKLFGKLPPVGRHWMKTETEAKEMIKSGDLRPNENSGWPEYRIPKTEFITRDSLWDDITASGFTTGYPTEKKEEMIQILLEMCSKPGDIILDSFIGSGTTAAVAQKLGRRWIGCDINKGAIQTTAKRLQKIINEQMDQNPSLPGVSADDHPTPCQSSFYTYQVNDYDLQIQHNEAVQLACEHMGITRSRTDAFFDGVLGKKLAKIIPFNHPLSPLDLEEIKNELGNRPEEDRDIVVAALGKELSVTEWLEDWNRLRRQGNLPNKIEVVELRSDPKYGGFFTHQPAQARAHIRREGETAKIQIEDLISPSILQRLQDQSGVLAPSIEDWRSMVDSVMIDPDYDGNLLNVVLADVPEKKDDLVAGEYELPIGKEKTKIAVKITDMLGEEVLIVEEV